MIVTALRTYLVAQSSITDLVGQRVYGGNRDQGDGLPALTIRRKSGGHAHNLDGAAGSVRPLVEVSSWAASKPAADSLAEAVRLKLQGFRGAMGALAVSSVTLENDLDLDEPPRDGSAAFTYRVNQDYLIRYSETIPSFS